MFTLSLSDLKDIITRICWIIPNGQHGLQYFYIVGTAQIKNQTLCLVRSKHTLKMLYLLLIFFSSFLFYLFFFFFIIIFFYESEFSYICNMWFIRRIQLESEERKEENLYPSMSLEYQAL